MTDWLQRHKRIEKGAMVQSVLAAMQPWGLLSLEFLDQAADKPQHHECLPLSSFPALHPLQNPSIFLLQILQRQTVARHRQTAII